jgi:hypothetical protein
VSTSFVTNDKTSPFVFLSKYFIGNLFSFSATSLRNLYVTFCATCVIVNPPKIPNTVLSIYNIRSVSKIFPIFTKLIPLPPDSLEITPLKTSVVAFPSILGPIMLNIVSIVANINISINKYLYFDK